MFQEDPAGSSSRRTSSGGSSNTGLVVGLVCPWTSKASDGGKGKAREKDRDDEGDKVLGDEGEKCIRMWSLQVGRAPPLIVCDLSDSEAGPGRLLSIWSNGAATRR
jgi:hypothetical protein